MEQLTGKRKSHLLTALCILCFAVYPILAAYAHNVDQLQIKQLFIPLATSLLLAALFYGVWLVVFRNSIKACLSTALLLLIFWNYELLFNFMNGFTNMGHRLVLPALLMFFFLLLFLLTLEVKAKTLINIRTILLLPMSLLVAFNLFVIGKGEITKARHTLTGFEAWDFPADRVDHQPDIYILVFDEYASLPTMQAIWGYDNRAFAKRLEEKGFFFARNSKTRYSFTHMAIPGILDLNYPDEDISRVEGMAIINNNHTFRYLHQLGYEIHFLDGWGSFEYTAQIPVADFVCLYNTYYGDLYRLDEFSYMLFSRSLLTFWKSNLVVENANLYYQGHNFFLDYIENFPAWTNASEDPRLLYAHVMAPHLPFVFKRDGSFNVNPTNYWEYRDIEPEVLRELYLEQYIYITQRIDEITSSILADSDNEPVILMFSDHGPRRSSAGVAESEHHHRVLNAVYFPGQDYRSLHDSIAPVNTMRVFFNAFFGTDYDIYDDL